MALDLATAPTRFRLSPLRGNQSLQVDKEARVIGGFSVVTRGPALGHGMWLDAQFVADVARLGSDAERGLKSRFTHPGLSSDGTGKALGRARAFRVDGDKAKADLHLLRAASRSPDGDLSGYVMDLAEEDPAIFGTSIVFIRDGGAERDFASVHRDDEERFQSPDPLNTDNLPHARIRGLLAVDVVDDPAANPGGFFDASGGIAAQAEGALEYVLGLSDQIPGADSFGGVHPERARAFVSRFLVNRGLSLAQTQKEPEMADQKEKGGAATVAPEKREATLADLKAAFADHPTFIVECLEAGRSLETAVGLWQERQLASLEVENHDLKVKVEALEASAEAAQASKPADGADPVAFGGSTDDGSVGDFMGLARQLRDDKHPRLSAVQKRMRFGMRDAIKAAAVKYPAAHAAFKGGAR